MNDNAALAAIAVAGILGLCVGIGCFQWQAAVTARAAIAAGLVQDEKGHWVKPVAEKP